MYRNNVDSYQGGCDSIVYLATTVERLLELSCRLVYTDRNAALSFARAGSEIEVLDSWIDWPLMRETYWQNTDSDQERKERRMAECLALERVPWSAIKLVAVKSDQYADQVRAALATVDEATPVKVKPDWYF